MQNQSLNEEAVFQIARRIQQPEALAAYLEQACGGDQSLRARVLALLGQTGDADQFLEAPPSIYHFEAAATMDQALIEKPGTQIGPYKLLQQIGEGGMGAVYMAEQKEPLRRTVALKIIKPGMDSQQVVARFEAERQALAMMNHPNIAKVLDAGSTESGRPYFVMELVKGIPITEYCDTHKLTTRQRLELLVTICDAVQHAHQKGIIHRDLKPGNLLVELHDIRPVPKVVDFGIAKSTNQRLTERTLCTNFSQMIGTPLYMSPEQAQLSGLDVDTRSDIYSLGVLLYELITGTTPFTKESMSKIGYDEMRRKIQYDDPPRPSERISTLNVEALTTLTTNQRVDTRKLQQQVRNELDWVVMKALDKDRTRRYQTATAFAEDIQRYLNDAPVQACPPSFSYRLQKITRRNKGLLITGALVAASLCAGLLGTSWQAILATRAEAEARQQERTAMASADSERQARELESDQRRKAEIAEFEARQHEGAAKDQLAISNAVTDFLQNDLLGQAGSYAQAESEFTPDPALTIRKALDRASASVGDRFKDRPELEAAIRFTVGKSYNQIGQFNQAIDQLERSAEIRTGTLGPEDHITLETLTDLAHSYRNAGRSSDAIELYGKICSARLKDLGPEHADTLQTRAALAYAFQLAQKTSEAIDLFEQVRDSQVTLLGPEHKDTLRTLNNLSIAYLDADRSSDAIKLLEHVIYVNRKLDGDENPKSLNSLNNLALAYKRDGRRNEARAILEKVRDSKVKIFGPEHPDTLLALVSLAESYNDIGKTTEAILMYEQARDVQIKILGPEHPHTLGTLSLLAESYRIIGKTTEAILIHRQVHDARARILGPEHPSSLMALNNLAIDHQSAGNTSQAIEILDHVRDVSARILGSEHRLTLMTLNNLAVFYKSSGKSSEAIELYKQVCDARLRLLGPEHRDTLWTVRKKMSHSQIEQFSDATSEKYTTHECGAFCHRL